MAKHDVIAKVGIVGGALTMGASQVAGAAAILPPKVTMWATVAGALGAFLSALAHTSPVAPKPNEPAGV